MAELTCIVDTNVVAVADGRHAEVSPECIAACATRLNEIVASGRVAIDDKYAILNEYLRNCKSAAGRGPGSAFVKWVLRNQHNVKRCDEICLVCNPDGEYADFPDDVRLARFDPADKKFVVLSRTHSEHPPILEAADSKWLDWQAALASHGVPVDILCLKDMQHFRDNKSDK